MPYSKILLPMDGSEHARLALRHAVDLARCGGKGHVVLLHSFGEIPALIGGEAREELVRECTQEAEALLAEPRALLDELGVSTSVRIVDGAPGRAVIRVCEEEGCDTIVMGSRGLSELGGMIMGSVTHQVLQLAKVPVLVVR
ncbi:universal stress protein [Nitratidesulfovibrio liaohensis]|uniref:universal stress protein n=1 Tax=Nitratidesulfovibrio liaohensis TaxID=2604158 RepID=UPI0014205054|nr:universal stress protein [Nitratidesulfovibrio liaohensis]NHZ47816.1 universal stress protein [Nitratidesulfovibrio liaohensis]